MVVAVTSASKFGSYPNNDLCGRSFFGKPFLPNNKALPPHRCPWSRRLTARENACPELWGDLFNEPFRKLARKKLSRAFGSSRLKLLLPSQCLPLGSPIRLHAFGLCVARSRGPSALALLCRRARRRERSQERILRRPATPLDGALESFNCPVELVALYDEQSNDVFSRHNEPMISRLSSIRPAP